MTTVAFDFETTDIPDFKARSNDPKQPHIVEMALITYGDDGVEQSYKRVVVRPDGWTITPDNTLIHGITHEEALAIGIPEAEAAAIYLDTMARAMVRVAHNESFDRRIARIALTRAGYQRPLIEFMETQPAFCTCTASTKILNLPPTEKMKAKNMKGPKSPNLKETVAHFFPDETIEGLHGALADARYAGRVYWHLKSLGKAR